MRGATVCKMHGGKAPQVQARAKQRVLEAKAVEVLDKEGVPQGLDPLAELLRLASEVVALKDMFGARVREASSLAAPEVAVFERALDRCGRVLAECSRLDLDARLVIINEAQGKIITRAITGTLEELGLTHDEQYRGRLIAARRLREATRPAMQV